MQALSTIDMSVSPLETVVPAKSPEPQGKEFGKVLNEQRQPERTQQAEKPKPAEKQVAQQTQKQDQAQETKQSEKQAQTQEANQSVASDQQPAQQQIAQQSEPSAEESVVQSKLQQTLINLMKVVAGGETPELVEEFGSTEELLNQLVQQLEGSELNGEQVLAGIDLTVLVEQLQAFTAEGGEEQMAQLVEQIEAQLVNEEGLLANAELAAAMLPNSDPQATAPKLVENLAQARQILQKALDSLAPQKAPEANAGQVVATEGESQEQLFGEESAEEVDPRFAGLLKPRSENRLQEQQSLRQQVQGQSAKQNAGQMNTAQVVTENPEQTEAANFTDLLVNSPKQAMENLVQQAQGQAQPGVAQVQQVAAKVMPATPMVQLPSGQQVAESQIFDQVVARFSGSFNGESGKMVLRMQPAELGSLKIELMVEGDRIRANLQAQSMQVQEVLERNLPQLRSALAEQGLKIDQFQVDVNQDQSQQEQFEQLAQQQQQRQGSQTRPGWNIPQDEQEEMVPLAHLMQNGGGGISLHV